jgi:hypothetical protein
VLKAVALTPIFGLSISLDARDIDHLSRIYGVIAAEVFT